MFFWDSQQFCALKGFCITQWANPNDEVLNAHPLYGSGLGFYGFHEVENSPMIADLDRRNQVHRRHVAGDYIKRFRHWIMTFHDETLEVVARNAGFVRTSENAPGLAVRELSYLYLEVVGDNRHVTH